MNSEQITQAVALYSETVGYKPDGSRKAKQVQFRAAIINALHLAHKIPDDEIAKSLNITRTTALFHRRRHDQNLRFWEGYQNLYNVALKSVYIVAPDASKTNEIAKATDIHVARLEELKDYLYRGNNLKHAKYMDELKSFILMLNKQLDERD
jgi:hypothetical protein